MVGWYRGGMMSVPESSNGEVPVRRAQDVPAPVWLQRTSVVVLVCFCFTVGIFLAWMPWSPVYWDQNAWIVAHPAVDAVLMRGWVRGLLSGVGLLDVWIGVSELLHYRDFR